MEQCSDRVQVRVAMGDHDALWPCRRPTRVVDGEQVALADVRTPDVRRFGRKGCLVVEPSGARAGQRDELFNAPDPVANTVHAVEVLLRRADDGCPGMVDDVGEIVGRQPVVDGYQHGANLRHGVKRLELLVDVRCDVGDPVALANAHPLERGRPAVAAVEELLVAEPEVTVDYRLTLRMQPSSPPHELDWRERRLHASFSFLLPLPRPCAVSSPDWSRLQDESRAGGAIRPS